MTAHPIAPAAPCLSNQAGEDDVPQSSWTWLGRCMAGPEDFLSTYWSVQPYFEPGPESRFADTFTIRELDRLMAMRVLRNTPEWPTRVRMVKAGTSMPAHAFTRRAATLTEPDPTVDCQRVAELIRKGGTLIIEGIDRVAPGLSDLCGGLETELAHRVGANAYLTPAESQGHNLHYDSHDVMILQISGIKHWRVFDHHPDASYKPELVTIADEARPVIDTTLSPGDVLYIPEGWAHVAETAVDVSLHITLGISQASRYDLLRYALDALALRHGLHKPLPAGFVKNPSALAAALVEGEHFLAQAMGDCDTAAKILEGFARTWRQQERRDRPGLIAGAVDKLREK